jgi:hypothetical protein
MSAASTVPACYRHPPRSRPAAQASAQLRVRARCPSERGGALRRGPAWTSSRTRTSDTACSQSPIETPFARILPRDRERCPTIPLRFELCGSPNLAQQRPAQLASLGAPAPAPPAPTTVTVTPICPGPRLSVRPGDARPPSRRQPACPCARDTPTRRVVPAPEFRFPSPLCHEACVPTRAALAGSDAVTRMLGPGTPAFSDVLSSIRMVRQRGTRRIHCLTEGLWDSPSG